MESYSLYKYADYDQYLQCQIRTNRKKLHRTWVTEVTIMKIVNYLTSLIPYPTLGLCHGTRSGFEQRMFMSHLPGCTVIGTEIAPTASAFPNTIEWDFHNMKPEWEGAADFVYSNSLDHSYDPEKALGVWVDSLKPSGLCFLESWATTNCVQGSSSDPFSWSYAGIYDLISRWGLNKYGIFNTFFLGRKKINNRYIKGQIIVIKKGTEK